MGIDYSNESIPPGYRSNLTDYTKYKDEEPVWVPKWVVEYGAPKAFQEWELGQRAKEKKTNETLGKPDLKRPRGRPRKETGSNREAVEDPAQKRPRGRPRKDASKAGTGYQGEGRGSKQPQPEVIEISD